MTQCYITYYTKSYTDIHGARHSGQNQERLAIKEIDVEFDEKIDPEDVFDSIEDAKKELFSRWPDAKPLDELKGKWLDFSPEYNEERNVIEIYQPYGKLVFESWMYYDGNDSWENEAALDLEDATEKEIHNWAKNVAAEFTEGDMKPI